MLTAFIITVSYFTVFFIVAQIIKNNSIVDVGWGAGFVLTSWLLFFISGDYTITKIIVNILVSLWGLRLFYSILRRNLFEAEDFRYAAWRKAWGKWVVPRAFLQVFMLQAFIQFVVGSTSYYINVNNLDFKWVSVIGIVIWIIGYYYEVLGDYQLKMHIKNKTGGLLKTGLWAHTRHPNYFGEAIMWWGIFLFALLNGVPVYYIISPIIIHLVLRFISIPLLEEKMEKYDGWNDYASIVPIHFPIVGKKSV